MSCSHGKVFLISRVSMLYMMLISVLGVGDEGVSRTARESGTYRRNVIAKQTAVRTRMKAAPKTQGQAQ